jgi:hypothetical protein
MTYAPQAADSLLSGVQSFMSECPDAVNSGWETTRGKARAFFRTADDKVVNTTAALASLAVQLYARLQSW